MILVPELRLLLHVLSEVRSLLVVVSDLLRKLHDSSVMLGDLLLEHVYLLILVLLGLRALLRFHIAPIFVIIFIFLLRHQPEDHFLDHLLDFVEWTIIGADLCGKLEQCLGASHCRGLLQEVHSLCLWVLKLKERDSYCGCLERSGVLVNAGSRFHEGLLGNRMCVRVTHTSDLLENLNSHAHGLDLTLPNGRSLPPLTCHSLAFFVSLLQRGCVISECCRGLRLGSLRIGLVRLLVALDALLLRFGVLGCAVGSVASLFGEVVSVQLIGLCCCRVKLVSLKLSLHGFEGFDDATRLEGVGLGSWLAHCRSKGLGFLHHLLGTCLQQCCLRALERSDGFINSCDSVLKVLLLFIIK